MEERRTKNGGRILKEPRPCASGKDTKTGRVSRIHRGCETTSKIDKRKEIKKTETEHSVSKNCGKKRKQVRRSKGKRSGGGLRKKRGAKDERTKVGKTA